MTSRNGCYDKITYAYKRKTHNINTNFILPYCKVNYTSRSVFYRWGMSVKNASKVVKTHINSWSEMDVNLRVLRVDLSTRQTAHSGAGVIDGKTQLNRQINFSTLENSEKFQKQLRLIKYSMYLFFSPVVYFFHYGIIYELKEFSYVKWHYSIMNMKTDRLWAH